MQKPHANAHTLLQSLSTPGQVFARVSRKPVRMISLFFLLALATAIGKFWSPMVASSMMTNRYVATTGTNAGDCSNAGSPCATVAYAVSQSASGDTINVAAGTYVLSSTVSVNVANLTIKGNSSATTIFQVAQAVGYAFNVGAAGVTLNDLQLQKTDVTGVHELILVTANNFTLLNSYIHGPDPGTPWSVNGIVSRALVVSGGLSGLLIQNNTFKHLRQPAYINPGTVGQVLNNNVGGTRGWVIDGAIITFSGNTWGAPVNQGADIALLASCNPANYPNLVALSNANSNAFISAQFTSAPAAPFNGRATAFVDDSASPGGDGSTGLPYQTVSAGVGGVLYGGTVNVAAGTYIEDVNINRTMTVSGAGITSVISGAIGGSGSTVTIAASNVEFKGFKITREGNAAATWNNPSLNLAGLAIQGTTITGVSIHDNLFVQNRTAIDINNSSGHTIRNNVLTDNRTGIIFRNQTDNQTVVENEITNNWTVGVLFLDASGGTNVPVQSAANCTFFNNKISGNWYGQIVDRQSGGSLPVPGTNIKNFTGNWLGSSSPAFSSANSAEPGYAALIPSTVPGGSATAPGGQPDVLGTAVANLDVAPYLTTGTDTNVETTPGRGTYGFQGDFSGFAANTISVNSTGVTSTTPSPTDNDYTRINSAVQAATSGDTIILNGTFNWTETNAAASWAAGSDGNVGATADNDSIYVPANRNNITFTANALGNATIQGPGDLPAVNLEAVLYFDGGDNQNWTISNIRFLDFDNPIGMYQGAGGSDAFNGTKIQNNYIRLATDLDSSVAPGENVQNIAIHLSYGINQTVSGNTIELQGNGVRTTDAADIVLQSNTSGSNIYNGLQITNNIIRVLQAQSANPEVIIGIWDNAHGHSSNITISGNQFLNMAAGNNPATNLQRAFRITSHSSATTTVKYENNTVRGANIGFQWRFGPFTGNQPVQLISNTIVGNNTGVDVAEDGVALLKFNRIAGNLVAGVAGNSATQIVAENNWWGCNFGPGAGGTGCTGTANSGANSGSGGIDANPWLTLGMTATPTTINVGGTSNLTAKLTINSGSVDTSGMGTVPNVTPVSFAGVLGTVLPTSTTTTAGIAASVFTGTAGGMGSGSSTVDQQTVSSAITINQGVAITCPANIVTNTAPNQCSATVNFTATATGFPAPTVTCAPPSGSTFTKGVTTVTCTASNGTPPDATCSFTVTVNDAQPPTIACPANLFLATTGNTAVGSWAALAVGDNCPGVAAPVCAPPSGSNFPVGVTTVTCSVADAANNSASCSFTVTVNRVGGSAADPLACTGPGNTVQATLVLTNNGNVNQTVTDATTFTNLVGIPGSCTVTPNVGTCTISNANLSYSATLTPGQTVTITYLTQASDAALSGAQVCSNNSVSFNGGAALNFSVCDVVDCPAVGPGALPQAASPMSDQKAGSVLIYNVYTSSTDPIRQNTRINLTNIHSSLPAFVHLFFVAEGCSVADSYVCLTPNQTTSFLASDLDPGTSGYIVAVAVNAIGCPINFNYLIGDEYVKFATGHAANLGAIAFSALAGGLPACDSTSVIATLNFDGVSYNRVPATLALDNVGSRADGNDTLLILNRIGGNLGIGASSLGTLFGILYDDAENALSFNVTGACQLRNSLTNNFPRTTPRFETFIPAGRTGWLRIYNQTGAIGMTGSAINFNANSVSSAGAFNQGHNLHALTLNATSNYIIPVFPPSC